MNVIKLNLASDAKCYGGKAANLARLMQNGLPVPNGFAVGLGAFDNNGKLTRRSSQKITELTDASKLYAVRSSALAEDSKSASWAGQFETFLNVSPADVAVKVEDCHNSANRRVKAYAKSQNVPTDFHVAVVVQEMLQPEYAGVLFTKDPVSGASQLLTEYIEGLGEDLVGGRADPKKVILGPSTQTPFNSLQLIELADKTEKLFGVPQDIEWVWLNGKIWLIQARPITATGTSRQSFDLGQPSELFYWGPSRAKPMYMSDFMAAIERIFAEMTISIEFPTPPKTLVLFDGGKMVWLNNAAHFADFVEKTFDAYKKQNRLEQDIENWQKASRRLSSLSGKKFASELVNAWYFTEFAEFALYGAEAYVTKMLARFDNQTLSKIWGAFTLPNKFGFLAKLDIELGDSSPGQMAVKYPWIRDGYAGPNDEALWYFTKRSEAIKRDGLAMVPGGESVRRVLAVEFGLTDGEQEVLALVRRLVDFMDDRKAWMMQTRRLIKESVGNIKHGWFFDGGNVTLVDKSNTHELWQRYVDFKASDSAVSGTVANSGGRHFVFGEVRILNSHVDPVENDMILVVPSTSPGWVPLMRHARALVTDHGGMMSHAAIVAREFNLPCIVGTQNGTKVLKNGEKVILDLVKGEVCK